MWKWRARRWIFTVSLCLNDDIMTDSQPKPLLNASGLRRAYPTPTEPLMILDGVDMRLAEGESLSIMGPSGSGKSTLLQILGTLDRPDGGTLTIGDVNPFTLSARRLARFRNENIGFIFQDHHLLPQCNVLENVLIPSLPGRTRAKVVRERAKELIEKVGLTPRISHRPAELSGGERQRVAVARSLINAPKLLLCDEPTGNLDRKSAESVGEIFSRIQADTRAAIVVVTHSAEFAQRFRQRFQLLEGKLQPV